MPNENAREHHRMKRLLATALLLALSLLLPAFPRSHGRGTHRIARSYQARRAFRQKNPCPSSGRTYGACPGWIIDHVVPLKRGGPDEPGNMQWQTAAEAKAKDRVE